MTEAELAQGFEDLEGQAAAWLARENVPPARRRLARAFDMRYVGQNFELTVTPPDGAALDGKTLRAEFLREHERVYGYAAADEPVQIVALRLTAFGDRELPPMPALPPATSADAKEARIGERGAYFEEARDFLTTPVYRRERLRAGHRIHGPAIVEQMDSTTVIPDGQEALVDARANLVVQVGRA
jgi:N-methylhydantoinase A